jgi:hypothetical protein
MASIDPITILIAAKDEASAVIQKTAAETKAATGEVNAMGNTAGVTGGLISTALVTGLVAASAESAKLGINFQQAIMMLHTNAGVALDQLNGISDAILNMSSEVGQGPEQLAQAFYHIASAGTGIWTTAQQIDILKVAAEGADVGVANLDDTTYALTSTMSSGIGGIKSASEAMGVLTAIVGAGDMKLQDLNGALSTGILSTAKVFGISLQSVGTALATLTDNGEHADEAATRLRMTFSLMASPSSMAAKQLETLGLTAEDAKKATADMNQVFAKSGLTTTRLADDLRQPNGITVAMKDLQSHLESAGLSASETDAMLSKAFGGGRTDAALLTMLTNIDRMDEKFKVINQNAGNFAKNVASQQTTAAQQLKDVWSGVQAVLTRVGLIMIQIADTVSKWLAPAFKVLGDAWMKYVQPSFDRLTGMFGNQIITFFGVLLLGAIMSVVAPIVILGTVFGALVIGIDYGIKAIVAAWNWLWQTGNAVFNGIVADIHNVIAWFQALPGEVGNSIANLWGSAVSGFNTFTNNAVSWARNAVAGIVNEFGSLPSQIGGVISGAFNAAGNDVKSALHNAHIPGFATGGYTGRGGTNDVAGIVHKGEYVVPQSQVDQSTGLPKMSSHSGATVIINGGVHTHNQMDEQKFLKDLGWRLSIA